MEIEIKYNLDSAKMQELIKGMSITELLEATKIIENELSNRNCTPITKLKVGVRTKRIFNAWDISYIEQLSGLKYKDLMSTWRVGKKSIDELIKESAKFGVIIKYCEKCKGREVIWNNEKQEYVPCFNCT